ncbi:MAG: EAL domain-containing protein [Planctomycetota bacterium]
MNRSAMQTTQSVTDPSANGLRYVGRQGIFDRRLKVWAYELLDRDRGTAAPDGDGDAATARVLHHSTQVIGLSELTNNKPAFVNFTRQGLLDKTYSLISPDEIVVELLEDIVPDAEVIAACREVKEEGYRLALDDFTHTAGFEQLLPLADIVKIDWPLTTRTQRWELCKRLRRPGLKLLAEKVETPQEYAEAQSLGCELFQGYFFQKPQTVQGQEIPSSALAWMRFIERVNKPEVDFDKLEEVVKSDTAVATKLLRRLNNPVVGCTHRITSIKQALVLMGEVKLRRWGAVVATSSLAVDKPTELMVSALVRAQVCETLGASVGIRDRAMDLFTLGLVSLIDAMTGTPIETVLKDLRLAPEVNDALISREGPMGELLDLVITYEHGKHDEAAIRGESLGVDESAIQKAFYDAVLWADRVSEADS